MSAALLDELFDAVSWQELEQVHDAADKALVALSEPRVLGALWDRMAKDEVLRHSAENFNAFQKFVLHENDRTGLRLRLHVFSDRMVEEAHNHRASFSARVLRGGYRHFLYGNVEDVWGTEEAPARPLSPRFVQEQIPGLSYTLHHAFVHSTYALPGTVSLVVQGPRVRPSFRIYDLAKGVTRTRVGAGREAGTQEAGERRLDPAELAAVRATLTEQGVLT
ncbi:hypothetical protein GCM10017673_35810 [Streptosporangium violaceochromogenes]|nr:hypothetical protein GCM10017673_35810 [Streptosporangium violaceochromogenes]